MTKLEPIFCSATAFILQVVRFLSFVNDPLEILRIWFQIILHFPFLPRQKLISVKNTWSPGFKRSERSQGWNFVIVSYISSTTLYFYFQWQRQNSWLRYVADGAFVKEAKYFRTHSRSSSFQVALAVQLISSLKPAPSSSVRNRACLYSLDCSPQDLLLSN